MDNSKFSAPTCPLPVPALKTTLQPELVIFGCGARMRFAHPRLQASLINAGIGVETMDTAAACRTYNLLVAESRSVVAALLIDPV